ncbi:MAG: histidine phosphatase family protein [Alphaproteobacteria bacterium]
MILLRHAQSLFNVTYAKTRIDPGIEDPQLTDFGREQARAMAERLRGAPIRRVITSPYTRALQTTQIVNAALGVPVTVECLVSERGAFVCDVGTERDTLATSWPDFDFSHLDNRWWRQDETESELLDRCRVFRAAMAREAEWPNVLVITHWGFIRGLTGVTVANAETIGFDPTTSPIENPFAKE